MGAGEGVGSLRDLHILGQALRQELGERVRHPFHCAQEIHSTLHFLLRRINHRQLGLTHLSACLFISFMPWALCPSEPF